MKALYRRAQAHLSLQDYVEAEVDIRAALQVRNYVIPQIWVKCLDPSTGVA